MTIKHLRTPLAAWVILTMLGGTASSQVLGPTVAESPDSALYAKLSPLVEEFRGRVGIYVRHLRSGRTVSINADEVFPTASMIKVPILVGVFDAIERGRNTSLALGPGSMS